MRELQPKSKKHAWVLQSFKKDMGAQKNGRIIQNSSLLKVLIELSSYRETPRLDMKKLELLFCFSKLASCSITGQGTGAPERFNPPVAQITCLPRRTPQFSNLFFIFIANERVADFLPLPPQESRL